MTNLSTPTVRRNGRMITADYLVRSDPDGSSQVVAVWALHSGGQKCFLAGADRVRIEDGVRSHILFAGIQLPRIACSRYSEAKLQAAFDATVASVEVLLGNEKLAAMFDPSPTADSIKGA